MTGALRRRGDTAADAECLHTSGRCVGGAIAGFAYVLLMYPREPPRIDQDAKHMWSALQRAGAHARSPREISVSGTANTQPLWPLGGAGQATVQAEQRICLRSAEGRNGRN